MPADLTTPTTPEEWLSLWHRDDPDLREPLRYEYGDLAPPELQRRWAHIDPVFDASSKLSEATNAATDAYAVALSEIENRSRRRKRSQERRACLGNVCCGARQG